MQTFKKIPGTALESETIRGSFYVDTVEQPNPGFYNMEIWKDIKGYEGCYQISNLGRVKSLRRYVNHNKGGEKIVKERIRKNSLSLNGYCFVRLSKKGIIKKYSIHRLVGFAFIPNPNNKPQINHKNGIKTDNQVKNLEWVTHSENIIHSYKVLGRIPNSRKPVAQYNINGILLNTFKSATDAAKSINGDVRNISRNCLGGVKKHRGYIFKYI